MSTTYLDNEDRIAELERELAAETNNKQEFERDWLACCDKLNDERRIHLELEETLVEKLEAAQAREKVLIKIIEDTKDEVWMCLSHEHATRFSAALRLPPADDTALRAALKAERERCAKVCLNNSVDGYGYLPLVADAIRALGE